MTYSYLPEAELELREATAYYEGRREGLGGDFLEEVVATIKNILSFPAAWTMLSDKVRMCMTNRFPYGLVYQVSGDDVLIVAVMHLKRRPGYWKKRLRQPPRTP